jgi:assimilatory nitrate reductase catalytic subunit
MLAGIGSDDGIRGLLVFGSDLAVASPDAASTARRLGGLDLLVVADTVLNATGSLADAVLPVTQWAEEDGTTTNLEGRVIRRRRAVQPPEGVLSDIQVLVGLSERFGRAPAFQFGSTEEIFDELRAASAGGRADYSGITYGRLDSEPGVFWPCPEPDHPGSPRMFADGFGHPDGRARMVPVEYRAAAESPDERFPVYLTTGRYREHYNSGSQTRTLERLQQARPAPSLQIHPQMARDLGITPGSEVLVESRRGSAVFEAEISAEIRSDTVFAPIHWSGNRSVNLLTSPALDPVSKMPEFKVCAVRVRPA